MSDREKYGSGGIIRQYLQMLTEKIDANSFTGQEKILAQRSLDQLRDGDLMRADLMLKLNNVDETAADEAERCLRLLLQGAYLCGAFCAITKTSEKATLRTNTSKARKARLEDEALLDEMRRREAAILDAVMSVRDADWDRLSNYKIAKSIERQAEDNFAALGGEKGPDRKTIERWIERHIRASQTS